MKANKLKLEALISKEKTLGNYIFDEKAKCFFSDVEIILYLSKIDNNIFQSELYFWDGYEVALDDDEKETFYTDVENAKKMAVINANAKPELFMGFPILYTNISCQINSKES